MWKSLNFLKEQRKAYKRNYLQINLSNRKECITHLKNIVKTAK